MTRYLGKINTYIVIVLSGYVFVHNSVDAECQKKSHGAIYQKDMLTKVVTEFDSEDGELDKFYALDSFVMLSSGVEDVLPLKRYAFDLLEMAKKYEPDWNYGNAIHHGNILLGRIALKEKNGRLLLNTGTVSYALS